MKLMRNQLLHSIVWSRLGYLFSRIASVIIVGISAYLFIRHMTGTSPDGDDLFRSVMGVGSAVLLLTPYHIQRLPRIRRAITASDRGMIEMLLGIALAQNGIGALGFYRTLQYYDLILHVSGPLIIGITVGIILSAFASKLPHSTHAIQWRTVFITFALIILWELWEWGGDYIFGTSMFGQATDPYDTYTDVLAGCMALIPLYFGTGYIDRLHKHLNRIS